jgi:peptidyl-prolyl cis-trans isomerase D
MYESMRRITRGGGAYILIALFSLPLAVVGYEWLSPEDEEDALAEFTAIIIDNDEEIKVKDIRRRSAIELTRHPDPSSLSASELNEFALAMAVRMSEEYVVNRAARQRGIRVPDRIVNRAITREPLFHNEGRFSADMYLNRLAQLGYSPDEYRDIMSRKEHVSYLLSGYYWGAFYVDSELKQLADWYERERDVRYFIVNDLDLAERMEVAEAEIEQEYEQNGATYLLGDKVSAKYFVLTKQDFHSTVREEVVQEALEQELEILRATRDVYHILLQADSETTEEEVRTKLEALRQRHLEGEDFLELAKEYSDDHVTRDAGGYLGELSEGGFPEEFMVALDDVPAGTVSNPVRSSVGWHLLYESEAQDIDREELLKDVRLRRQELRDTTVYQRRIERLEDLVYSAVSIDAVIENYPDHSMQQVTDIGRQGHDEGIFNEPRMLRLLFSDEFLGGEIVVSSIDEDSTLVIELEEYKESRQMSLEQARDDIKKNLQLEKAQESIETYAEGILEQIKTRIDSGNETPPDDYQWTNAPALKRHDTEYERGAIAQAAFSVPKPEEKQPVLRNIKIGAGTWCIILIDVERTVEVDATRLAELSKEFINSSADSYADFYIESRMFEHVLEYPRYDAPDI